ncbi:hypothetical protein Pst134EB_009946 [Puccinia striiformis f. sp. tritici]|nr:hypothetical protein Pst134EB_009946 [Puccinia striiformis f. sp. tritici]
MAARWRSIPKHLPDFQYDENKPYAELWMGTHTSLPSKLMDGKLLSDHLSSDPAQLLGKQISDQYGSRLPFLFKVLAIGKALSIQAHPDRQLAIKLHRERPDVYKDDNHKVSKTIQSATTLIELTRCQLPSPRWPLQLPRSPAFAGLGHSTKYRNTSKMYRIRCCDRRRNHQPVLRDHHV